MIAVANKLPVLYDSIKYYNKQGDFSSVVSTGLKTLELAKSENDKYYLAKTYYLLAFIYAKNDDFGNSIIYYLEGARFAELSDNPDSKKDLISIYKNLSNILSRYRHFDLAHKFMGEGLRVAQSQNNTDQIVSLLHNKIQYLLDDEKYDQALIEIQDLLDKYELSKARQLSIRNKIGIAYHNLGDNAQAIENYMAVIDNDPNIDPEIYSLSLMNLGNIFRENKDLVKALAYYTQTIQVAQANNLNIREIRGNQQIGITHASNNEPQTAIEYFQRCIVLMESGQETPNTYEIYRELSNCYTLLGDYETALKYERIYSVKLEEFIEQQKKIEELDKKYNIQLLTERYFDLLAADQEKKETERLAKFGIGGTSFVFLSILFLMLYKQQRTKLSIEKELTNIELTSEV